MHLAFIPLWMSAVWHSEQTLSSILGCHYTALKKNHAREAQPHECAVALLLPYISIIRQTSSIHARSLTLPFRALMDTQNHYGMYKPLVRDLFGHDTYNKKKRDHCNKPSGNIKGCCMRSSEACDALLKITSLGSYCYSPFSKNGKVKWVKVVE